MFVSNVNDHVIGTKGQAQLMTHTVSPAAGAEWSFGSEEKVKSWLAHGSPAAVIDKINQFLEAGCTTPVLRFVSADQRGQLERCVHEVLPAFEGVRV